LDTIRVIIDLEKEEDVVLVEFLIFIVLLNELVDLLRNLIFTHALHLREALDLRRGC